MFETLLLLAQEGGNSTPGGPPGILGNPLILLPAIFVLFYFLMIRPMRRQEQQRQALIANTKKGDKVITHAGIIGTVVAIADKEDEITLKVDDNVRLKMLKSSIARNVTQEEAAKEQKGQAEAKA
ncbi:MAG TPA: preprotein translocase subunit YajC [Gemmataceae bacterium]|nr:preprotein translocase subunit YajC [Gemmataceae bacterium]